MTPDSRGEGATGFSEARVAGSAVESNTAHFVARLSPRGIMAVLSGNAYGHGAVSAARHAVAGGATWLGTARLEDAAELRRSGRSEPIVFWQLEPRLGLAPAVQLGLIPAVSSEQAFELAVRAGIRTLHLVCETGTGMPGIDSDRWEHVVAAVARLQRDGRLGPVGIMASDGPGASPRLNAALGAARRLGVEIDVVHSDMATGDAAVTVVRVGAGLFGLSDTLAPAPADLVPALTLSASVLGLKHAREDAGISYGYTYRTRRATRIALVSLGYGDGIDRAAGNRAPVVLGNTRFTIAGRVAMDACVLDVGELPVVPGERAVFFGDPDSGVPSAQEWAEALEIPSAAVVSGLTARVRRAWS